MSVSDCLHTNQRMVSRYPSKKNGISFEVLNLPHNYPVTNLGFLVDLGGVNGVQYR